MKFTSFLHKKLVDLLSDRRIVVWHQAEADFANFRKWGNRSLISWNHGVSVPVSLLEGEEGRMRSWLGDKDSNLDSRSQSPLSYH